MRTIPSNRTDANGGYAEYMTVQADFAYPIPSSLSDFGSRAVVMCGRGRLSRIETGESQDGQSLGLMGFGGSNHLVLKMVRQKYPNSNVFVFSRNRTKENSPSRWARPGRAR